MTTGSTSCYNPSYNNEPQALPDYAISDQDHHVVSSSLHSSSSTNTFLYNLSLLKEKVHQVQSLASIFIISPDDHGGQNSESTTAMAMAMPTMSTLIQEIIVTASSMMFACQQMTLCAPSDNNTANHDELKHQQRVKLPDDLHNSRVARLEEERGQGFYAMDGLEWYGDNYNTCNPSNNANAAEDKRGLAHREENNGDSQPRNYDIVELDAADLLAKYTHHCKVCGKGFKRDANLRMHMRAHGESYKSSAALCNPLKNNGAGEDGTGTLKLPRKYSCPQEGCRWNRNHAKFQPLKSMICVKNHYRRSHCPKMYVCNRCNRKQFSVLSDLRTHEKHCGDNKWQCSCGTTFSRKDKLMGHVALFTGHTPAITSSSSKMVKADEKL